MSNKLAYLENIGGEENETSAYRDKFHRKYHKLEEFAGGRTNAEYIERLKKTMLRVVKNELNAHQQELVRLYYFKDFNTCEIAEQLGVTPQAVSASLIRARNKIKKFLDCCV